MAYTADKPPLPETPDELRARIPGWGADLNQKDRPAVPRERSVEHKFLTPVFGTSSPPKGLSGVIRKQAYARYSEGRAAHWLLLLAADRVDAWESHLASFATARPDNPVTETGVTSEPTHHGISSRLGQRRADLSHQPLDPLVVAGPWVLAGGLVYAVARSIRRSRRG